MSDSENQYLQEVSDAVRNNKLGTDPGRLAHYQIKAALATATEMHLIRVELEKLVGHLTQAKE